MPALYAVEHIWIFCPFMSANFLRCGDMYQVLFKLLRRYKYLEKSFEEELVKVIS